MEDYHFLNIFFSRLHSSKFSQCTGAAQLKNFKVQQYTPLIPHQVRVSMFHSNQSTSSTFLDHFSHFNLRYDSARWKPPLPYTTMHFTTYFHTHFGITRVLQESAYQKCQNFIRIKLQKTNQRERYLSFLVAKSSEILR